MASPAQLNGLLEMTRKLNASNRSQAVFEIVATSVKTLIPVAQSVVLFTRATEEVAGGALKVEFADTPFHNQVRNLAPRDDEGLLGKAIGLSTTILIRDTEVSDNHKLLSEERSAIVAPLFAGADASDGKSLEEAAPSGGTPTSVVGALYVGAATENTLDQNHLKLLATVSSLTTMALAKVHLYEQLQRMGLTDSLTGLCTHRLFKDKLREEIEYADRHDQPVVLVMVDADNFKTYNDTLGHPAGDTLLREISALLKDKVRPADIVCRYGGGEFALLLKNTLKEDAARMCERIREAFQMRFGGNAVRVTSSIGLACFPIDADSEKDLAQAADTALYVSKRGGRNRVTVSKTLQERRANPIAQEVLRRPSELRPPLDENPPWEHPQTAPRKPPPKNVPGQSSRKLE
jgi:diguanylate cyclase (GGDEF)-like protein